MELSATHLRKSYQKRVVVQDVSLNLGSEIVGLLGPNGAGKTTSFYMLIGLIAADRGRVLLNGQDITRLSLHQRARLGLGYLPQEASIFRGLTAEENIMSVLERKHASTSWRKHKLEELLEAFGVAHVRHVLGIALSGGERRRVEMARTLAGEPQFILLDEPFAGIDPLTILEMKRMIFLLRDQGMGVLITDHNVREMLSICDRIYIVNHGLIFASGTPQEVVRDEQVRTAYLGHAFVHESLDI